VGLLAAGLWLLFLRDSSSGSPRSAIVPASPVAEPVHAAEVPRVTQASHERPDPAPVERREDLVHPHPITPERIRIQHENQLVGAMNDAMDLEDGPGLRKILNEYEEQYPEDPSQLQEGYRIIAECLEHPSAEAKAAGQRYYDEERGSLLRVFVARHCLER
jgi:hypothetical protein